MGLMLAAGGQPLLALASPRLVIYPPGGSLAPTVTYMRVFARPTVTCLPDLPRWLRRVSAQTTHGKYATITSGWTTLGFGKLAINLK